VRGSEISQGFGYHDCQSRLMTAGWWGGHRGRQFSSRPDWLSTLRSPLQGFVSGPKITAYKASGKRTRTKAELCIEAPPLSILRSTIPLFRPTQMNGM
jgi:hypothetical protein